jgi:DeoR/GlpR family transcriptional regulator of sugar metabolism
MMTPGRVRCTRRVRACCQKGPTLTDSTQGTSSGQLERWAWTVVPAASGKVGTVSPYVVAPPERADVLVTDGAAEEVETLGVQVVRP